MNTTRTSLFPSWKMKLSLLLSLYMCQQFLGCAGLFLCLFLWLETFFFNHYFAWNYMIVLCACVFFKMEKKYPKTWTVVVGLQFWKFSFYISLLFLLSHSPSSGRRSVCYFYSQIKLGFNKVILNVDPLEVSTYFSSAYSVKACSYWLLWLICLKPRDQAFRGSACIYSGRWRWANGGKKQIKREKNKTPTWIRQHYFQQVLSGIYDPFWTW